MIITDQFLLRIKCSDVLSEEISEIKQKLEQELQLSAQLGFPGIGLSAPQVGIYKKMAIIRCPPENGQNLNVDLVNAKIVNKYDKIIVQDEGCLSFPNQKFKTFRYNEILVENEIHPKRFVATGLFAICIQHELDHLDGILVSDITIK